jgi:hypothetical protein
MALTLEGFILINVATTGPSRQQDSSSIRSRLYFALKTGAGNVRWHQEKQNGLYCANNFTA